MSQRPLFAYKYSREDNKEKKKWCINHPTSFWGSGYKQCAQGFRLGEECEEGR